MLRALQEVELGLWCLMPFSALIQLYRGGNRSTLRKPPTIFYYYHMMVYRIDLAMSRIYTRYFIGEKH